MGPVHPLTIHPQGAPALNGSAPAGAPVSLLQPLRRGLEAAGSDLLIRRLLALWSVAHTGSMIRAAKLMGVSQPSLSQQLAGFEAAVGGRLFHRRSLVMHSLIPGRRSVA